MTDSIKQQFEVYSNALGIRNKRNEILASNIANAATPNYKARDVDFEVELARVLSGGDTDLEKTVTEDDLYKLELSAFMKLIETQKTQDRIKHTLTTGKPLVN